MGVARRRNSTTVQALLSVSSYSRSNRRTKSSDCGGIRTSRRRKNSNTVLSDLASTPVTMEKNVHWRTSFRVSRTLLERSSRRMSNSRRCWLETKRRRHSIHRSRNTRVYHRGQNKFSRDSIGREIIRRMICPATLTVVSLRRLQLEAEMLRGMCLLQNIYMKMRRDGRK